MLELTEVSKSYARGDDEVIALPPTSLAIEKGEFVGISGPSGSGKSTLLAIAGLLLPPDSGEVRISGLLIGSSSAERSTRRVETFGYVFQGFNLFDHLTAAENVLDGLRGTRTTSRAQAAEVHDALERVGMVARANHMPNELSGGEQQRVAIARALVKKPLILLADEPTGNLDTENSSLICDLLVEAARGSTVILVTHDPAVAERCERIVTLGDAEPAVR